MNWDINAFILGARAIEPADEVMVIYTNSWWDPVKEGQVAEAMLDQNADVIANNLSSSAPFTAAEKRGVRSVGFQLDMSQHAPKGHLTSVVFHWEKHLVPTIKKIIDGTWEPSPYGAFPGIAEGVIDITPLGDAVPADVQAKIEDAKAQMAAGKFSPFDGPLAEAGWQRSRRGRQHHRRRCHLEHEFLRPGRHRHHAGGAMNAMAAAGRPDAAPALLSLAGICKSFDGRQVLDDACLDIAAGEVHALLGENGAGKSTLMNVLTGVYAPDRGEIRLDGRLLPIRGPRDAIAAGIGMVHQHFRLVDRFSAAENLWLSAGAHGALATPKAAAAALESTARELGLEGRSRSHRRPALDRRAPAGGDLQGAGAGRAHRRPG